MVNGTITYSPSTWTDDLVYEDDNGNQIAIASPTISLSPASWSFTHPALAAGSHTVSIKDPLTGTVATSNTFMVGQAQSIVITQITGAVAGSAFTFAGTLNNYTSVPTLTYALDGGTPQPVTGVTQTGWSMQITIATAGSYTIQANDGSIASPVVTFTVASVTVNHVIIPQSPTPVSGVNYIFYDTFTTLNDVTDAGGAPYTVTTITASPTGQSFKDPAGNTWTIVSGEAYENGSAPAFSANVIQLSLVTSNGVATVWQENASSQWYYFTPAVGTTAATWTAGNNPLVSQPAGAWMNHYPFGGSEYTLSANGELEYYTSATRTPGFSPFSLIGGSGPGLVITTDTATYTSGGSTITGHTPANSLNLPYNSGCISTATETSGEPTLGLLSFTYGLIEIYAKLPGGSGYWTGFALYRQGTPTAPGGSGELDIMENGGGNLTTVYGSIHSSTGGQSVGVTVSDYTQNFHNYACNWTATTITWLVDGVQYASYPTPTDFIGNAYYIAIDQAIQGNPDLGFDGVPNSSTPFPNTLEIQWVRVSQGTTNGNGVISAGELCNFIGTITGYTTAPALTYQINNAPLVPVTGVTSTGWSMQFNAPNSAGVYSLTVSDGTTKGSTSFTVGMATPTITPLAPANAVAGHSFTFTGNLTGYTTIPALAYTVNGGSPVNMTGVSVNGWSTSVVIATAGAVTMVVSDGTYSGTVSFTVAQVTTALRNWYQNPGQDLSFWVCPFYSSANWITSGSLVTALRGSGGSVNQKGNYAAPWYIGKSTDAPCTVTDGTDTIVVHLPVGAVTEAPFGTSTDSSIGGADSSQPYLVWSLQGASISTGGTVVASGSTITGDSLCVNDGSGLMLVDAVTGQPGNNNTIGGIQDYELQQLSSNPNYVIQHMLCWTGDPATMIGPTGPIWPLKVIDSSFSNGGPLPQGLTIGIPANVARPTGRTRGFYALWDNLQQFGWFFYNVGGTANTINITVYDSKNAYASLVADIVASINAVVANVCILNYDTTVAGSQYSLATTKGYVAGATLAFPAPPPIDLSPTNGVDVLPSTFGAWYPSGYNVIANNTTTVSGYSIIPTQPISVVSGKAFTFTGVLSGYSTIPTLTYSLDGGSATTLAGVTTAGWSTTLTITTAGTHTLTVNDVVHSVAGATTFVVTSTVVTGNPVTWNSSDLAGSITLSTSKYIATAGGSTTIAGSYQGVRATSPIATGLVVLWEASFSAVTQNCSVGLSNSTFVLNQGGGLGGDANGIGFYPSTGTGSQPAQSVYYNAAQLNGGNGVNSGTPFTVTVVTNGTNAWFSDPGMRSTSGVTWNNSTTANPVTNTGGFAFTNIGATFYPTFNALEGGGVVTIADGTSASPISVFASAFIAANPTVITLSSQTIVVNKSIQPSTPNGVIAGAPFTFTGTLVGYTTAPNLTYQINTGASVALSGVTATGWSTTLTLVATGNYTITVTDGTVTGSTASFAVTNGVITLGTRVPAPLTGTVTTGSWVSGQTLAFAMPGGGGNLYYNVLLPAQYTTNYIYPILFFGHTNDAGMNGGSYPLPGSTFVSTSDNWITPNINSVVNTVNFRTAYPCIIVMPQCDQSLDSTGGNGNANFGGYADSPNSGANEQANIALAKYMMANYSADTTRMYWVGTSLGAIGGLAQLVDNNIYNGINKIWTAAVGLSDQLYRPSVPNTSVFPVMANVPYLAISTPSDNNPASYDQPAWTYYTGNSNYPSQSNYDSGGMAGIRAGTSQFYYIDMPSGAPWNTLLQMNADGGDATVWWNWLFSQIYQGSQPTITGVTFTPASTVLANSAVGTVAGQLTVASANGALTGVTYTLGSTAQFTVNTSGQVLFNSASVAANSYSLTVKISASNASNSPQTYSFSVTVSSTIATGAFKISNGKVLAPDGSQFIGRGVALHDYSLSTWVTNAACQPLTTLFPKINMLRLGAFSYWSPATYAQQVAWLTAQNIVVVVCNMQNSTGQNSGGGSGVIFTGTLLAQEQAWFQSIATYWKGNTYVWYGTNNEPSVIDPNTGAVNVAGLWAWQQTTYNTVRNTGNTSIVEIEQPNPYLQGAYAGLSNTVFSQMTGIIYGPHYYSWIWGGQSTAVGQSTIYNSAVGSTNSPYGGIVQQVANIKTLTSLDGVVPCGVIEFGVSTDGVSVDAAGINDVNAVFQAVNSDTVFCSLAWALDTSAPNLLVSSTTALTTPYGSSVAAQILNNTIINNNNTTPTPPPQASAVGYTTLLFNTDFVSASEVDSTGTATSNPPYWFLQTSIGATAANAVVQPTMTAAQVSNGNTGGGSFASPNGGILVLNGPNVPGSGNVTLSTTPEATQSSSLPSFGSWKHVYFEAYIQFNPNITANNQWFAWWSFSQVAVGGLASEIDFIENYCGNFSYADTVWTCAGHDWTSSGTNTANGGGASQSANADAQWHLYGCLWVSTGPGTGQISFYRDNVLQVIFNNNTSSNYSNPIPTGTGSPGFVNIEAGVQQYMKLGGPPDNMYVDYVRVWGA